MIFTGTPGSTSAMQPGDVVEIELENVGVLRNTIGPKGGRATKRAVAGSEPARVRSARGGRQVAVSGESEPVRARVGARRFPLAIGHVNSWRVERRTPALDPLPCAAPRLILHDMTRFLRLAVAAGLLLAPGPAAGGRQPATPWTRRTPRSSRAWTGRRRRRSCTSARKHMVTGTDHLLFLVGVIFFLYRLRDVVLYVSLFTLGHSITLLLGVLGGLEVNAYLIDAIIGLSVCYKAFENMGGFERVFNVRPNTKAAVLIFGLFHGLGLATKLQEFTVTGQRTGRQHPELQRRGRDRPRSWR